jgi:hypothetical protein
MLLVALVVSLLPCLPALFLTAQDYANARYVSTNTPMKPRLHDQHFRKPRHKRGSGVAFESDKWPNGRVPYVLSAAYSKPSELLQPDEHLQRRSNGR